MLNNINKTFRELFFAVIIIKLFFGVQGFLVALILVSPDPVYDLQIQLSYFLLLDTLSFIPAISYMIILIYFSVLKKLNLENNLDILELTNKFSLNNIIKYIAKIYLIYIVTTFTVGSLLPGGLIGTFGKGFFVIAIIWLIAILYKILKIKKVLFSLLSSSIFYLSQLCLLRITLHPIFKDFLFIDLLLLIIIISLISTPLFFVPYLFILNDTKNLGDVYKCIIKSKNIVKKHILKYFVLNLFMLLSLSVIFTPMHFYFDLNHPEIIFVYAILCLYYMSYFVNKMPEILKDDSKIKIVKM